MSAPILATKLYIPPPRPNAVLRPRLIERLNNGLLCKLTLICAPAGFGKSTLVSQWICTSERPVTWLSLDEADDDQNRFLNYFIAALQKIEPTLGAQTLAELQSPQPPPTDSLLTALLNEISTVSEPVTLALDDYHVIDAKPINDLIAFILDHIPPQFHLLIATREDPDLPLARLRARCQLSELRAADLRFTADEAAKFLNQAMDLKLDTQDIDTLEARTEGWIVGLQLAAISMQGHNDTNHFIQTFTGSHHFVLDYLLEETLQQQSESVQNFLLATSILERMNGPLCDVVVQHAPVTGQETLELIEQANLFIIPLDDKREWYRYHHLFADVLQARLKKLQPETIPLLHQRASEWFEQNGQHHEAIQHALSAEDFERAASLCELAWPEMDRYIQSAPWLGWVRVLPEELVRCRPVLMINYAWALLDVGELEAGEERIHEVEAYLENMNDNNKKRENPIDTIIVDEEQFRLLPSTISSARAYLAQTHGDIPTAIKFTHQTLSLLPDEDHVRHTGTTAMLGLCYCTTGDLEIAYQTFSDAMAGLRKAGYVDHTIGGTFILADIRTVQGRLFDAVSLYEQSLQLVADEELFPQGTAYLYLGLGKLHREWANTEVATQYLQRSEEINEKMPLQLCQYRLTLAQARVKEDQGDLETALYLLNKAERLFYRNVVPELRPVTALKARIYIAQGKFTEALAWVREYRLTIDDELTFLREFEHITLVRLLIAQYRNDQKVNTINDALKLAKRLIHSAQQGERMGSTIEILLQLALAHEAIDENDSALDYLEKALTLAKPEAYVRIFIDEGTIMAHLLSQAVVRGIIPDYANKLLAAFENGKESNQYSNPAPAEQALIEPLSKRELEVLRLIARGYSNQEISEKLYLALSSIKGHNQKIFSKLQVQRRTEAVARARQLALI